VYRTHFSHDRIIPHRHDFNEQLAEWTATVADVRVHGTTHARPIDRFVPERDALVPAPAGRAFRLEAPLTRVVATHRRHEAAGHGPAAGRDQIRLDEARSRILPVAEGAHRNAARHAVRR